MLYPILGKTGFGGLQIASKPLLYHGPFSGSYFFAAWMDQNPFFFVNYWVGKFILSNKTKMLAKGSPYSFASVHQSKSNPKTGLLI